MHTPGQVRTVTGLSETTLRRYTRIFAEWLSPAAQPPVIGDDSLGVRSFTDEDIALLLAIKRQYDARLRTSQILAMLRAGSLRPALDAVTNKSRDAAVISYVAEQANVPAQELQRLEAVLAGLERAAREFQYMVEDLRHEWGTRDHGRL